MDELEAAPTLHYTAGAFCFQPGGESGRKTGLILRLRQTTFTSLAWETERRGSRSFSPNMWENTATTRLVVLCQCSYSPCLSLGEFGTVQDGCSDCEVEARWAHVVVVVSLCCRPWCGSSTAARRNREIWECPSLSAALCTGNGP